MFRLLRITNSKQPIHYNYSLNSTILQETNSHSYLGVEICSNMKWNNHISHIAVKANGSLGFKKRNLRGCTEEIKNIGYRSLVRPIPGILRCSVGPLHRGPNLPSWGCSAQGSAFRQEQLHDKRSSVTAMMQELNWPHLAIRRKIARICLFQKARGWRSPSPPSPRPTAPGNSSSPGISSVNHLFHSQPSKDYVQTLVFSTRL